MSNKLDDWRISYYLGAIDAAKREIRTLVEYAQVLEGRVEQFDRLLQRLAAGTWKPMDEAPKDGTHILIQFTGGLVQVCYWDEWKSGWVIAGDHFVQIHEEPIAWAEILSVPASG
jgi:hypothetical protein